MFIAYKIFRKISDKKSNEEKGNLLQKISLILFISTLLFSLNSLTFITSYSFFWNKVYRVISENKHEAVVIGYKKEILSSFSSFNKTYLTNKKSFYFGLSIVFLNVPCILIVNFS